MTSLSMPGISKGLHTNEHGLLFVVEVGADRQHLAIRVVGAERDHLCAFCWLKAARMALWLWSLSG